MRTFLPRLPHTMAAPLRHQQIMIQFITILKLFCLTSSQVHNAKPLHLDRKLCELAETITIDMAQKRVTDVAKALLPCESSQYSVTILFAQGKPTTTCMTGQCSNEQHYDPIWRIKPEYYQKLLSS